MPFRSIPLLSLALALAASPVAIGAQAVVQPLPGTTDADRLAEQVQRLAANPQDLDALVTAGDLSIRLDDTTAAAAFFTRADKIDPRNARVKAGEAALLVRNERPGEALRYFAQAQSYGLAPEAFAADRGLAYDLIGEQARAQADYRTALKAAPKDDETIRRYALSLGISGKQQQALDTLAPILTATDRAAWRVRAFILAMNGDLAGAEHIAGTMMPGAIAQGLQPFFARLPTLDAIDRAFAVHFGEVRSSPQRVADARLAPPMAPLPPEPVVAVAAVSAPEPRKGHKDRHPRPAAPVVTYTQMAQARTAPPSPQTQPPTPTPTPTPPPAPVMPPRTAPPVVVAATRPVPSTPTAASAAPAPARPSPSTAPTLAAAAETRATVSTATPAPTTQAAAARTPAAVPTGTAASSVAAAPISAPTPAPVQTGTPAPSAIAAAPTSTPPAALTGPVFGPSVAIVEPVPATRQPESTAPLPTPGFSAMANTGAPPAPARRPRSEDAVLDKIMAGLSIPATELNAAPPRTDVALADAHATRTAHGRKDAPAADPAPTDTPEQTPAERKAAERKAAAAAKAIAAKKAAAEAKAAADKEAAKEAAAEKKAAKANPSRIWVQVAGGANEDDLPKAWAAVKKKAPEAFAGRSGYKTPLRATNRVLAGPFKTDADARAFVNTLKKSGLSGFAFTSPAGQKIEKLPAE